MKGLIIIGSTQVNSHTSALARYLAEHFKTHNIEAEILDLTEKPLNRLDFSGTTLSVDEIKQNMKNLKEKAMAADFLILGTPSYRGSHSGMLRNTLDHLGVNYFRMKPVGLVGNSGDIISSEPLSHLKVIVRSLLGIAVPTQIATHDSDFAKNEDGSYYLNGSEFQLRARLFVDQIVSSMSNSPYEHLK